MKEKIDSSMIGPAEASLFRSGDQIRDDINELLEANPETSGQEIRVSVSEGVVTLQGKVGSDDVKNSATAVALDVLGVTAVRNELEVAE
jgi:osmotically-inducible protein OsmY